MTDTLLINARVRTLCDAQPTAEAVLLSGERIAAIGDLAELRARAARDTREIDLGGGVLIPGFVDAHSHLGMVGEQALHNIDLNAPPIGEVTCMDELVARMRERADREPPDAWIEGRGYDDTLLREKRHPTRLDLDRVSTTRPVVVRHISGHLASANSVALALCGVSADTPDPVGGIIRRDASGEPDGVLEESGMFPVLEKIPPHDEKARLDALEFAAKRYVRMGITTAQNGFTSTSELADFDRAFCMERMPLRVVAWPGLAAMRNLESGRLRLETPADRLTAGAIKLFADGSIQGYTGHLCHPYHVPFKGKTEYRGYAAMPRELLVEQVTEIYAAGRQVAVHTNGDAAIDDFLHAVEKANATHPRDDARPIAVHAQMSREDQLDEMKRLGVVPSFFCLHTYYWGDRHRDIFIGPERAQRISPARSAVERGMHFTIHTDAPVVPMDPMLLMWSAVNRRTTSGKALGEAQCLTPLQALRATTLDAAYQLHLEGSRGSIEAGKLADLALLDADPLEVPHDEIRRIRVRETWVGGERVSEP